MVKNGHFTRFLHIKSTTHRFILLYKQLQLRYDLVMDNKKTNGGKMSKASMVGVRAKINEEYEIHIRDFERVYKDVYGRKINYNPFMGYESLGENFKKPEAPCSRSETVLYGTWKVLRFIEELRPDLKKNPIDRGVYVN